MKNLKVLMLFILIFLICGCKTFPEKYMADVKKNLLLPNVYYPANNNSLLGPGQLVIFYDDNFLPGLSVSTWMPGVETKVVEYNMANSSIKKNGSITTEIVLTGSELTMLNNAGVNFGSTRTIKVDLNFKNGKGFMLAYKKDGTDILPSDILFNLNSPACKRELAAYYMLNNKTKFFLPRIVYQYDVDYTLNSDNKINSSVTIPAVLAKVISAKLNLNYQNGENAETKYQNYYIGFVGYDLTESFDIITKIEQYISEQNRNGNTVERAARNDSETLKSFIYSDDTEGLKNFLSDPNVNIDSKDPYGDTALMHAVVRGKVDAVRILIEKKANIKLKNGQTSALKYAQSNPYKIDQSIMKQIVSLLNANGAR